MSNPLDTYFFFTGKIDPEAVKKLTHALAGVTNAKYSAGNHHVLMHSSGGNADDGIFLYNFFRSLPVNFTLYNGGSLQSAAALAFLGAKNRKTLPHSSFMIHRLKIRLDEPATSAELGAYEKQARLDEATMREIMERHLTLSPDEWDKGSNSELWFNAKDAVKAGFAQEIGEFSPPLGTQIYTA